MNLHKLPNGEKVEFVSTENKDFNLLGDQQAKALSLIHIFYNVRFMGH